MSPHSQLLGKWDSIAHIERAGFYEAGKPKASESFYGTKHLAVTWSESELSRVESESCTQMARPEQFHFSQKFWEFQSDYHSFLLNV